MLHFTGKLNKHIVNRKKLQELTFYHSFKFDNGLIIPGWYDVESTVNAIEFPPLRGRSVLDIGPASGFFSFYFEQQGAHVTAIEIANPIQFNKYGINHLNERDHQDREVFNKSTFLMMREILQSEVEYLNGSIYEVGITLLKDRKFDLVFLGSLLVHLRDPIGAIAHAASVCKSDLIATTPILTNNKSDQPLMKMVRPLDGSIDWWLPNKACFYHWFRAAGLKNVDVGRSFHQYADTERPSAIEGTTKKPLYLQVGHAQIE